MPRKHNADVLGLGWLTQPRWGAVIAFLVALGLSMLGFVQQMAPIPVLAGAAVTLVTNYGARPLERAVGIRRLAVALLLFDTVLLTAVLYFTGGASNPLTALYMIPIAMGALMLPVPVAWTLSGAAVVAFGGLFFAPGQQHRGHLEGQAAVESVARPHPKAHDGRDGHGNPRTPHTNPSAHDGPQAGQRPSSMHPPKSAPHGLTEIFDLHLRGMWMAFTLTAVLVTYFVTQVAAALRARDAQLTRTLRRAERAERVASLASLAASTAHELGTPLASISLAASEMGHAIKRGARAEALAPDVDIVRSQIKRCREILDSMLTEAGETVGEAPIKVQAADLVARAVDMLPENDRPRIEQRLPDALPALRVPAKIVIQSVHNLLRNALDASSMEAKVAITLEHAGDHLRFVVNDRGIGMDAGTLEDAMEPFVTSKPGRGQGLGLFLTRAVADRLGGKLSISSHAGHGTTAVFEILVQTLPGGKGNVPE